MLEKIVKFLVGLLLSLRKLIPIPHSSEAESVFNLLYVKIKGASSSEIITFLTVVCLFFCVIGLLLFVISLWSI